MSNKKSATPNGAECSGTDPQMELPFLSSTHGDEPNVPVAINLSAVDPVRVRTSNVVSIAFSASARAAQRANRDENDALSRILAFARTLPGM